MAAVTPDGLAQIEQRVAALEAELAMWRATVAERVRSRSLVIEDDDGIARVVLEAKHRTGSVLVRLAGPPGRTTGIEVYACEGDDGVGELGWCVLRDGDVVSRWTAG